MPPEKTENMSRAQIADFLPRAISTALASYDLFLEDVPEKKSGGDDDDKNDDYPKKFKAHHDACKVALAHIELLFKLAQRVESAAEGASAHNDLAAMLAKAQEEVAQSEKDNY